MLKYTFLISWLLISYTIHAQEKIENGTYITTNKLQYITIKDDFQFTYILHRGYSPYMIKEQRKKEKTSRACGVVGYIADLYGNGTYHILDGKLFLAFKIDYLSSREIDKRLIEGYVFEISQLEKIEE